MKLALVGDIGGTNARFALWKDQQLESVQVLATAAHASPEEAIGVYLSGLGLPSVRSDRYACRWPVPWGATNFASPTITGG